MSKVEAKRRDTPLVGSSRVTNQFLFEMEQ